jgi:hypothetical protein
METGNLSDRTQTFVSNYFRGPSNNRLDARFTWAIPFETSRKLFGYVEGYNRLNQEHVLTVNGHYGPRGLAAVVVDAASKLGAAARGSTGGASIVLRVSQA